MNVVVEVPHRLVVQVPHLADTRARWVQKRPRIGAPTKCTPEVTEKIAQAIRTTGCYVETAVRYAGIAKSTFYNWLEWGNRGRHVLVVLEADLGRLSAEERDELEAEAMKLQPFVAFLDAIEEAFSEAELRDLQTITRASAVHWQAAAWRLERSKPDKWGRKARIEHTGEGGGPIETRLEIEVVQSRELTREEFLRGVRDGGGGVE